jgi:hypothetical protein
VPNQPGRKPCAVQQSTVPVPHRSIATVAGPARGRPLMNLRRLVHSFIHS